MIHLALLSLLFSAPTPSLAADGMNDMGQLCQIEISETNRLSFRTGKKYVFAGLPLESDALGYSFEVLTIDRGNKVYTPPIGAPITFGNIGLLKVKGKVQVENGKPVLAVLQAVGGLGNWWKSTFYCQLND